MPQRPAARQVAIAMYGLMSAAVCRYSIRVELALPGMTRIAQVRFSIPHDAVSGAHTPGTDLLIRIAELFNVSLDFLAFDNRADVRRVQVADRELLQKLEDLDKLSEADRATVKAVLDTFILKRQLQRLAGAAVEQPPTAAEATPLARRKRTA